MSGMAILIDLLALALSVSILRYFHCQAWYWHMLAITGALALGFIPTPPEWKTAGFDLAFGFVVILLVAWGVGGLALQRTHYHRHV